MIVRNVMMGLMVGLVGTGVGVHAVAADKVIGKCTVTVSGDHSATLEGLSYQGKPSNPKVQSSGAVSRAWQLKNAEFWRAKVPMMGERLAAAAKDVTPKVLCHSGQGSMALQAAHGGMKPADYPEGPHTYRLVDPRKMSKQVRSGDLQAVVMLTGDSSLTALSPTEPGQLKLTHSDGDRMAGTFEYVSGGSKVTGSFDFRRPDPGAK